MLITLDQGTDAASVEAQLRGLGLWTKQLNGRAGAVAIAVTGPSLSVEPALLAALPGVADVWALGSVRPLVERQAGGHVQIGAVALGGGQPVLVAGPCGAESEEQVHAAAAMAAHAGARILRGGAYKPRTSPYAFQGHGAPALRWLREAATENKLALVTEVMSPEQVDGVAAVADMLQVGSRNMQNFELLRAVGAARKPALLKRSRSATIDEWMLAGEHLLAAGAAGVVFCERGVAGLDPHTRNLLDLGAVALLKHTLGQPVMVDPSHAAGRRDLLPALTSASFAAGADAVMVECHPDPGAALSDGAQALGPEDLPALAAAFGAALAQRRGCL